jgi:outer membrane protein
MKKINFSIAVVLLLCTALPPKGDAFDAQYALWINKQPSSAELTFDPLGPANVRAFEDNRDVDEDTRSFGRFIVDMSQYLPNICMMATPIKYEGTNINSMRLDFGDESVKDDIALNSEATLNDLDIALYYGIPFVKTVSHDRLNVDFGINLRSIDFEDDIEQDSIDQASESFILPIPMVFAAVQFHPLDVLSLEAEGRGISIGGKKS